jgi:hypothetical protein
MIKIPEARGVTTEHEADQPGQRRLFLLMSGLLLTAVVVVVFLPFLARLDFFLAPRSGLGTDISYRHWPDLVNYARSLRERGQIALWDDSVALGRPLAGDPGVLWLYPLDLVFLIAPPAASFTLLAVFHVLASGLLATWFCRTGLQTSRAAALIGGLAFMLMPKFIAHLAGGHVGLAYGLTWLPLAMLGTHLAVAHGQPRGAVMAGLALALQLPTHIQIPFYTAALMGVYFLWLWLPAAAKAVRTKQRELAHAATRAGLFVLAVIIFVGLAAALLFPFIGLLPLSSRAAFTAQDAAWYSLPLPLLATILVPTDFQFPEWTMYVGIVPALLALLALRGPRSRDAAFFVGLVIFAALYSVGPATPVFPLVRLLPGFSQLRVPPRIWFFGAFGVACLAALGADAISTAELRTWLIRRRRVVRLGLVSLLIAGIVAAGVLTALRQSPLRLVFTWAIAIGALGLLRQQFIGKLGSGVAIVGLIGLTLIDLVPTARLFTMAVSPESVAPSSSAIDWLAAQPGLFRVYSPRGELPYAQAANRGVQAAEGLLAFQMAHAVEIIKLATGCTLSGYATGIPPCLTSEIGSRVSFSAHLNPRLMGLLNVRYILSSRPLDEPDLKLVADFGAQQIYQNQQALPRAFVVSAARTLENEAAVLAALPQIEPGTVALLDSQLPSPLAGDGPAQEATIVSYQPGLVQVAVRRLSPGLMILSQTWVPGWRATDNGRAAPVLRVDYAFIGVYLPAGEHQVEFVYDPPEWELGWKVSLATVIGLLLWAATLPFAHCSPARL